ncbi:hypothetical protein ACLOJK_021745 [Asimina triloba]
MAEIVPISLRAFFGAGSPMSLYYLFFFLLVAHFHVLSAVFVSLSGKTIEAVQEKAESTVPITTLSPPEGNTTFLEGTTWCVALAGASQADLQNALDWACGLGMADCSSIQKDGVCYEPDTLLSHASFAFNSYYQQNGDSDIACNFGGTATLTRRDPSNNLETTPGYGSCAYSTSGYAGCILVATAVDRTLCLARATRAFTPDIPDDAAAASVSMMHAVIVRCV